MIRLILMVVNLIQNIPREAYVIGRNNNTFAYLRIGDSNSYLAVNYNVLCTLLPSFQLQIEIPMHTRVVSRNRQQPVGQQPVGQLPLDNNNRVICYHYLDNEYRALSIQDILVLDFSFGEPRELFN